MKFHDILDQVFIDILGLGLVVYLFEESQQVEELVIQGHVLMSLLKSVAIYEFQVRVNRC